MEYDLFTHKHNFSVWAGARVAQRKWAVGIKSLKEALEASGLPNILKNKDQWPENNFDNHHRMWCKQVISNLKKKGVTEITYGRVAKFIAVYLKSMVVISEGGTSKFADSIHPPIDRIILKNLARDKRNFSSEIRRWWGSINWTDLNEEDYYKLIKTFRDEHLDSGGFWRLEKYWPVTN